MKLYGAIDLHSNNSVVVVQDEQDRRVFRKRLPNDLGRIVSALAVYQSELVGVVVESTYNWYWLVDGLMAAGFHIHLANTAAIKTYEGLKYTDDFDDASWLAHLLRVGLLKEGYICPQEHRVVRDLLRKRSQLVRQKTANVLSIQNLMARNTGQRLAGNAVKKLTSEAVDNLLPQAELALAVQSNVVVMACLAEQIRRLERAVLERVKLAPAFEPLQTVSGIGRILALTIMLETGEIARFSSVGRFASYGRCVGSQRLTNGKPKGKGNVKNGNKYLAWAFVEAANFAVRYHPKIQRFYQRKKAKTNGVVAIKAVAHKLARACYYILRDQVPFDVDRAFASRGDGLGWDR